MSTMDSKMAALLAADEVLIVLRGARRLLTDEWRWIQNTEARTSSYEEVPVYDPRAERFCLVGSLKRAQHDAGIYPGETGVARIVSNLMLWAVGQYVDSRRFLSEWNDCDHTSHADVLNVLDRAIARRELVLKLKTETINGLQPAHSTCVGSTSAAAAD